MNERVKHRIVGVAVLLSILAIALPLLLTRSENPIEEASSTYFSPPLPLDRSTIKHYVTTETDASTPPLAVVDWQQFSAGLVMTEEDVVQTEEMIQLLAANEQAVKSLAWVVQLASFANQENADNLVEQLRAEGYDVYMVVGKNAQDNVITRVFVNTDEERDNIEQLVVELKDRFALIGIVVVREST